MCNTCIGYSKLILKILSACSSNTAVANLMYFSEWYEVLLSYDNGHKYTYCII